MMECLGKCDAFILQLAMVKANVNFSIVFWLLLNARKLHIPMILHVEPCICHGSALGKTRSSSGSRVAASINSFSRQTREVSFSEKLSETVTWYMEERFQIKRERKPAIYKQRYEELLAAIFDAQDADYLFKTNRQGETVPTQYYTDVKAYVAVLNIGEDRKTWTHFCYVED